MTGAVGELALLYRDRGAETDGIRDYTDRLQAALRERIGPRVREWRSIGPGFSRRLAPGGDWVLQYNPFAYARWGFAPWLVGELALRRRGRPRPRIALMVHEPFVPLRGVRWTAMGLWQRAQLWSLMQCCDVVFVSTETWAVRLAGWWPARPVHHLPVGSNLPDRRAARPTERARLGVDDDQLVVAALASHHVSYRSELLVAGIRALAAAGHRPIVLLLGGGAPELPELRDVAEVHRPGRLSAEALAARFAAADLFVSPLRDGVSTRRGTVMAALQHALAVVGTEGPMTDPVLRDRDALSLAPVDRPDLLCDQLTALADSPERRRALGQAGRSLYESTFAWPVIAGRILDELAPV